MAVFKNIQWYASDKSDKSIIAYGFITENPQPSDRKSGNDYKIQYHNGRYVAMKKYGNKFINIAVRATLASAQLACLPIK